MNTLDAISNYMNVYCFFDRHVVDKIELRKILETHKPFIYQGKELYFNTIDIKCRKCRKPLSGSVWVGGLNEDILHMYCLDGSAFIRYIPT